MIHILYIGTLSTKKINEIDNEGIFFQEIETIFFQTEMYTIFAGETCIISKVSNSVCVIYRKTKKSLGRLSLQIDYKNVTFSLILSCTL